MSGSARKNSPRTFLVLPENRLAVAAVKNLAHGVKRRIAPLVCLVGPAGVGKSHLAKELLRGWEEQRLDGKLVATSGSRFAAEFAEASTRKTISQFQSRHRRDVLLLVCEDIQSLGPRKETQQQLLAAVDDVIEQGGVVLLTSTRMPGEIRGLDRRLVNRIHGGVCAPIRPPGEASRRKLLDLLLTSRSLRLTPEEQEDICRQWNGSPRELAGFISQLEAEHAAPASSKKARLAGILADRTQRAPVELGRIVQLTAQRFRVKATDLKGPRRSQTVSRARQCAMYLARELIGLRYVEIGEAFNRGNHSTVIHACQKIAEMRESDPALDREIRAIARELGRPE